MSNRPTTTRPRVGSRRNQLMKCLLTALSLCMIPSSATAEDFRFGNTWFGQVEGYASLFGSIGDRSMEGTAFGGGLKGGYRWESWGVFLTIESNSWVAPATGPTPSAPAQPSSVRSGALNIAVGGELIYANRYLRSALAIGPSILLDGDNLDSAGTTGLFVDLRMVGIRWPIKKWLVLMLDPVSFSLVAPVLTGIPLALFQFRSGFTTEFRW